MSRKIAAPRGPICSAKSWLTEAPLRMLCNNLDPDVAEHPDELIVYGGLGKAARNWECFNAIIETLQKMESDETLLIQSGKPVGVLKTHEDAPRVLIANSNIVPHYASWEVFHELDRQGLMMFGQMTAGSWIYIGSQGIVQGTYETLISCLNKHFSGKAQGRWLLTAGLGGMGGAQPLAAVMAGCSALVIECDITRIQKRLTTRYLNCFVETLDEALAIIEKSLKENKPVSVGLLGNAAEVYPELVRREKIPDIVTDQTSAHDPLNGYLPLGMSMEEASQERKRDPLTFIQKAKESMAVEVSAMLSLKNMGSIVFDYGNNIRQMAFEEGIQDAFEIKGFVPEYIRPLFCEGIGPFRWVALSGDPEDIYKTDECVKSLLPNDKHLHQWFDQAREKIAFQGLPARICWVGLKDRMRLGLAFNDMVKNGILSAPIVIGRDHLDSGSVASPNRETEAMKDGSDVISDWPFLNALTSCASGATWVSIHHGGGVGMGFSQHAGMVIVADGTEAAAKRLKRVLFNDPATGVIRHADAGYDEAIACAKENHLWIPMIK